MLEFLGCGIIKGRPRKYDESTRSKHYKEIDAQRAKGTSDREIAIRLGVSYHTVAKRAEAETNY